MSLQHPLLMTFHIGPNGKGKMFQYCKQGSGGWVWSWESGKIWADNRQDASLSFPLPQSPPPLPDKNTNTASRNGETHDIRLTKNIFLILRTNM